MGRTRHRIAAGDDADDDENTSLCCRPKSMEYCLEQLFEKRGSSRESALSSMIQGFSVNIQLQFAEKNFATLMHRYLNSIKRGSSKEICLACHAIGLFAITIGCGDNAHELYEESLPPLSQDLKSSSETLKLLDCLAIVTFVGGGNFEEIEGSMQIIWQFIHKILGSNVVASKHSVAVLCSAISAWSFLLTTMDGWNLRYKYWQGAISFFLDKLEDNEESIRVAAAEALALILEIDCLEKFSRITNCSTNGSIHEGDTSLNRDSYIQELKDKISKQVRNISFEANDENHARKVAGQACNGDRNLLKFLQERYFPEISVKIDGHRLTLSTLSQSIQYSFLRRFLGCGFVKHMLENRLLHDVFEFAPVKRHQLGNGQRIPDSEEVSVQFYLPQVRKRDCSQRILKSPNSALNKARAQLLNKQRMLSQGRHFAHLMVDDGSEAA